MREKIEQLVKGLIHQYDSSNPFEIAQAKNIIVLYESLGTIKGFYGSSYRFQVIHINQNMENWEQRFTCAHELGHAILHPNVNTPFLRENTLFSINKLELEANKFAAYLLISDEMLKEAKIYEYTSEQISIMTGIPEQLVQWRMKINGI